MKTCLTFLLCAVGMFSFAQRGFKFELEGGVGLNQKLYLHNEPVSKPGGTILLFGSVYRWVPFQPGKFAIESGLYGQYIYNSASVDLTSFKSLTLRSVVLVSFGYQVNKKIEIHLGTTFRNNRDYNDIFVNQAYNFRFDAMFKMHYQLTDYTQFTLRYYQAISKLGDPYFVTDPQFGILAGLSFFILDESKKNAAEK